MFKIWDTSAENYILLDPLKDMRLKHITVHEKRGSMVQSNMFKSALHCTGGAKKYLHSQ